MRRIDTIIIHCSATRADIPLSPSELDKMHRRRGFDGCGYHYYVRRDGTVHDMRPVARIGAHCRGHNAASVGICYEGGLDARGTPADTRTPAQHAAMQALVYALRRKYPAIRRVCGHRDLSPDRNGDGVISPAERLKQCPCFEAEKEFGPPG